MPFGDGTGPRGVGPMTGRRAGYCTGFGRLGFANPIPGRGRFGLGHGWSRAYGYPFVVRYGRPAPYPGYGYPRYGRGYMPFYREPFVYP
jgi:hypothetical protein